MRRHTPLVLQFDPSEIDGLVERYDPSSDDLALDAGRRLAIGSYDKESLKAIVKWKSPRKAALVDDNSDSDIVTALQFSTASSTPEAMAVAVLTALHGVGIPMASAILTAIHPEKYTALDYRALEALGVIKWTESINFYVAYLSACRDLATRHGQTLRNFDRALWQWSKEQE